MPVSADHTAVLEAVAARLPIPQHLEPVLAELRHWGWVMPTALELTGTGRRHLGQATGGLLG